MTSGFVADKSDIHYYLGGYQGQYSGIEVKTTKNSDLWGAIVEGYENPDPTPANAASYGDGPASLDRTTGRRDRVRDTWTEPLSWVEAQNMLFQGDAEENEGSGFAFANAQLGVPWLIVRGISDSVWYPNAFNDVLSSRHAAIVVRYLVEHLPAKISTVPETLSELSPVANARHAGYIAADRAFFAVGAVSKVVYTKAGKTYTLTGDALKRLAVEYTYAAGRLG